jgi:tetratricopeptide (TPR) repeat protein
MTIGRALGALSFAGALALAPASVGAEDNCANEFRSGKLYFSQKLYDKAVQRFARAVQLCPQKAEYHAHYALSLAHRSGMALDAAMAPGADPGALAALTDSVTAAFQLAAVEFDTSLALDDTKKHQKSVRENRKHFWVERYNLGLQLLKDENFAGADIQFRLARVMDPKEPKAYAQGAIALIKLDKKAEAAQLVEAGLILDPEDKTLKPLKSSIVRDAATELAQKAEQEHDAESGKKAEEMYTQVIEERIQAGEEEDANLYFDRGVARSALAAALSQADTSGTVSPEAAEAYRRAAEDFAKARELVPMDKDADFHKGALFNGIQALVYAEKGSDAVPLIKAYLGADWKDIPVWQLYAQALVQAGDKAGGVSALVVSRSLAHDPVPVDQTVQGATADAAKAMSELGKPEAAYSYQEAGLEQGEIETWIWPSKKTAKSFIRGVQNGQITW